MKKNNKGKKKLIDLDEYIKIQNNESCSKQSNKEKEKNISNNNSNNNKQKLTFKNCLENLVFLFPNFSRDLIEDIYQENNENFSHTKDKLRELSELEMNENKINENKMQIEEEPQKEKKKKKKKYIDISEKTKFEIVDKNDPIDDDNENIHYMTDSEDEKENKKNNKNENIDYNKLIALKEKSGKEYLSKFDEDNFNFNNNIIINNNSLLKDEPMIDDYLFEQNINFLSDCFPLYKKEQIIQKICENNFDINGVVSNILNETYKNITKDGDNLKNLESKDIEEILTNFEKNENDIDDDFLEIQKAIEHSIKTENNNNEIEENEEFFLNKNIDDIETPQIKNDLKKLVSQFPLEDVYNIKLVYYSYMDYKSTFEHFDNKDGTKNLKLKTLLNSISNKNYKEYNNTIKKIKKNNKLKTDVEKRRYDTLKKILENKPINWKFEEDKNINEKDFITIRNRLYREAKNFFACGKYKEGQLLLSRAKRYQQEIEQIAKNRGIKQFFNNNSYNNNSKEIDLHGLTVEESKLIINKKIEQLREKKDELNSKSISLTIITGTGSHSQGNRPVLFPKLKEWLKNKKKIRVEGSQEEGALFVTIF